MLRFTNAFSYLHDTETQTNEFRIFICLSEFLLARASLIHFMRLSLKGRGNCAYPEISGTLVFKNKLI